MSLRATDFKRPQKFPSYDIDRKRLESLLEVLYPPAVSGSISYRVSRRLDYFVVEAPSWLNDVSTAKEWYIGTLDHADLNNSNKSNAFDNDSPKNYTEQCSCELVDSQNLAATLQKVIRARTPFRISQFDSVLNELFLRLKSG